MSLSNPCGFAIRYQLWGKYDEPQITISNKVALTPHEYKAEPMRTPGGGWHYGYGFKHFWSNCSALLGDIGNIDGVQQLCHQYYLQNGGLDAATTIKRIKKLLGVASGIYQ